MTFPLKAEAVLVIEGGGDILKLSLDGGSGVAVFFVGLSWAALGLGFLDRVVGGT